MSQKILVVDDDPDGLAHPLENGQPLVMSQFDHPIVAQIRALADSLVRTTLRFETCTVHKLDHAGKLVTSYEGQIVHRDQTSIVLEARWTRDRLVLPYVIFEHDDRFIEFYFTDRWYNIFEIHDRADNHLKGWYCNFSRPAVFERDLISAMDLALDLYVHPNGRILLLDEDEFEALNLQQSDPEAWKQVRAAVAELHAMVAHRRAPFDTLIG